MTAFRSLRTVAFAAVLMLAPQALATFHLMQVYQVMGGVHGDTTAQAIQLRMRSQGQNHVDAARLWAWDANGQNPVLVCDLDADVANGARGASVLIASPNFGAHTSPPAQPDFVMSNLIPASYLAAGSLTFEDDFGTVYWRLSWGGNGYAGDTTGNTTNDRNGDFGPPFAGPLQSSDEHSLLYEKSDRSKSLTNARDYSVSVGPAAFVNNAGDAFAVLP